MPYPTTEQLRTMSTTGFVVQDNEILWDLCRTYMGIEDREFVLSVQRLNGLSDPYALEVGKTVQLPTPLVREWQSTEPFPPSKEEVDAGDAVMWRALLNFMTNVGASDDYTVHNVSDPGNKAAAGRVERARVWLPHDPLFPNLGGTFEYAIEVTYLVSRRRVAVMSLSPHPQDRYDLFDLGWAGQLPELHQVPESLRRHLLQFVGQGMWGPLYQEWSTLFDG